MSPSIALPRPTSPNAPPSSPHADSAFRHLLLLFSASAAGRRRRRSQQRGYSALRINHYLSKTRTILLYSIVLAHISSSRSNIIYIEQH